MFWSCRNENETENYNQQRYTSFVQDENEYRVQGNQYLPYDDYDTTDQEDYDYLLTDDESLY